MNFMEIFDIQYDEEKVKECDKKKKKKKTSSVNRVTSNPCRSRLQGA
jgi:hypothetical protein